MIQSEWTAGNKLRLLENGEAYFPFVLEAIGEATEEILIDTFILFEDVVGRELHAALLAAARRGVRVHLVVDGYGSLDMSPEFIDPLKEAGARVAMFDPQPRVLTFRTNPFRRLHRKTVVVDRRIAVVGGINFSEEHLRSYGPMSKQDYAVVSEGPVVRQIRDFFLEQHSPGRRPPWRWLSWRRNPRAAALATTRQGGAMLVVRDNNRHRDDIEHIYRLGIRSATRRIVIANAYFLPGYRLIRDLCNAARRGVEVCLILQGRPDMPIVRLATMALHEVPLDAGVRIHEYRERPLHAKVAVIDEAWSTVGSSNLDPLSLYLNLESNLVIRDESFTTELMKSLEVLLLESCQEIAVSDGPGASWLRRAFGTALFHLLRHMPGLIRRSSSRRQSESLPA